MQVRVVEALEQHDGELAAAHFVEQPSQGLARKRREVGVARERWIHCGKEGVSARRQLSGSRQVDRSLHVVVARIDDGSADRGRRSLIGADPRRHGHSGHEQERSARNQ